MLEKVKLEWQYWRLGAPSIEKKLFFLSTNNKIQAKVQALATRKYN